MRRHIEEPVARRAVAWLRENSPEWPIQIERRRGDRQEYLFWQSGAGYDRNITEGNTLPRMIDYVHENPVRKRWVTRAVDWKWSSAAWYVDRTATPLVPDPVPPESLAGI